MADDLQIRQPADPNYVNVNQPHERRWWCDQWGCTATELEAAVAAVGTKATDVERRLRSKGHVRK